MPQKSLVGIPSLKKNYSSRRGKERNYIIPHPTLSFIRGPRDLQEPEKLK